MVWCIEDISPLYRKGVWGIGNTQSLSRYKKIFVAGERLICAVLDESLPPETAQRFKSTMLHISFCFTACVCK